MTLCITNTINNSSWFVLTGLTFFLIKQSTYFLQNSTHDTLIKEFTKCVKEF